MDFKIPTHISFIIKEADMRSSSEINKAIQFFRKKLRKEDEFKKFKENFKKIKKESDKKKEEEKFLKYLHEEFLKQQTEYEEIRKKEQEKKRKDEAVFQEKMRLHELKEKLKSLDLDDINDELNNILSNLRKLFNKNNNNNSKTYSFYKELYDNINKQFTKLYKLGISYFFKQDYSFKAESNYFKLDELKNIISKFEELVSSNFEISIDIAEKFLETLNNDDEIIEGNIILAVKIAHTIFINYQTELNENFKELRKEFDESVSDELIYVALFVNNNYIDDARVFIEQKKNSGKEQEENWETIENGIMPTTPPSNSSPLSTSSPFLREIYNIKSHRGESEATIIQEYDGKVNNLHQSQKNYILFDGKKYDVLDFIGECLNNEINYNDLSSLYNSEPYINEHLKIPTSKLLDDYRKLLNCNLLSFKKKYIKYKIFEKFFIKFREILGDYDINSIYNSNESINDMFIRLILYYDEILNNENIDTYKLIIYLKIIACVIVNFYEKNGSALSIFKIIDDKIIDQSEYAIALEYIQILANLFTEDKEMSNEQYFKLFSKLRKYKPNRFLPQYVPLFNNTESSSPFLNKAAEIEEQLTKKINYKPGFKRALPPVVQKYKENISKPDINQDIVKRKIKATDEDKIQIITKSFEDMDKKDSLFKPLLGFHDNIIFEKNTELADIDTIKELKKIYEKNNQILDIFFRLLNTLSQLISLKDKNKKDYYDIEKNSGHLILVLEQLSDIFRTSITDQSEGAKITQLFNIIIKNIEINLLEKYDSEKSQKFKNKNKLNHEELDKYLSILKINIQEIDGKSLEEINKIINTQFRILSRETHSDKTGSSINNKKFSILVQAKDKLQYFYSEQLSENNNSNQTNNTNETNYNTNEYRKFRNNYLRQNPKFMPVAASAQKFKNIENKLRTKYKKHLKSVNNTTRKDLLNDIIIPRIRESIDIGKLDELTSDSLMRLFELFTPFNFLYDHQFNKFKNQFGNFILSIDNNLVKRFNILISSSFRFKEYVQLCFNMDNYIKYILLDLSFIDNIENKDSFKIIVYYNFFHNLKSIIEIILDYLTDKDPRHGKFFNLKKKLDEIIQKFKKLDKDKKYSIVLATEKNKSGIFASNRFNTRKVGKEQIKKQRETIMKTTKQLFEKLNSKNKTNHFFKKFDETKENKDKKILLLKKIKELLDKLINEYNISFENLLKSDNLKNIIESFFEKINTNLQGNYTKSYVSELIDSLFKTNEKDKLIFLKKKIFEPVITQLVDKLIKLGYKQVKFNILELLYIFAISFSSENQQLQNIKQQRKNINKVNNTVHQVITGIKTENKQQKLALIVIEDLRKKADALEGTHANPQQKQKELENTLSKSMEKHKVSPNLLAVTLSTVKPKMNTNSGKEFMKGINKLLITNSSTKSTTVLNNTPKTTSEKSNTVVPNTSSYRSLYKSVSNPSSYNSLTVQNKKNVVEKLKSAIIRGNVESRKQKINQIAAEINSNKPNHITTSDEFKKEIIKRFKPKEFKLTDEEEFKLIQELSDKNKNKTLTVAKQKERLEKIIKIITEIKKDKSITSLNKFKNKVQEKLESK